MSTYISITLSYHYYKYSSINSSCDDLCMITVVHVGWTCLEDGTLAVSVSTFNGHGAEPVLTLWEALQQCPCIITVQEQYNTAIIVSEFIEASYVPCTLINHQILKKEKTTTTGARIDHKCSRSLFPLPLALNRQ